MPFLEADTMTIPASKVRAVCTSSEIDLVRASRKGELEHLNTVQVKRLAVRARKLLEKWQDLGRDQSRVRSRKVGFGDSAANTRLKEEIFREALTSFEKRLPKAEAAALAAKKSKPKTKSARNAGHRSARAVIRAELSAAEHLLNVQAGAQKKPMEDTQAASPSMPPDVPANIQPPKATPKAAPKAARKATAKAAPKARPAAKAVPPAMRLTSSVAAPSVPQRKVTAAAKRARLVSSGKTTRMPGHISARGKRAQARRDGKK
jgi:hypothetical protein